MSKRKARGTLTKGLPDPDQPKQLAFMVNAALGQLKETKEQLAMAQTYLAAVLYEYGATEDGILISKKTMKDLQGQSFGIEKTSDKDGLSLRVVLAKDAEAEAKEVRTPMRYADLRIT